MNGKPYIGDKNELFKHAVICGKQITCHDCSITDICADGYLNSPYGKTNPSAMVAELDLIDEYEEWKKRTGGKINKQFTLTVDYNESLDVKIKELYEAGYFVQSVTFVPHSSAYVLLVNSGGGVI